MYIQPQIVRTYITHLNEKHIHKSASVSFIFGSSTLHTSQRILMTYTNEQHAFTPFVIVGISLYCYGQYAFVAGT